MVDKLIELFWGAAKELEKLDEKMQQEIIKYNNRQIKKTAAICYVLGIITVLILQTRF